MKKLILIVVLLFSLTVSAQKNQIVKTFSKAKANDREWVDFNSRVFFNYGGDEKVVKIYFGDFVEV